MLVYNGIDHFEYLLMRNQSSPTSHIIKSIDKKNKILDEILPSEESFYDNFTPDYTSCELMIRAIGYEIDQSSLIGHRLLLHRSSLYQKQT